MHARYVGAGLQFTLRYEGPGVPIYSAAVAALFYPEWEREGSEGGV